MRMSHLFNQTLREAPAGVDVIGHQLLLRAGFVRQLAAGIFSYLHLGQRTLARIEAIMREEIDRMGGQEIQMPMVQPATIWQESGRWQQVGSELGRLKDKNGRDLALAMTHEEVLTDLARHDIQSHRQLPQLLYHIQLKWRDDPRPRAGLIRAREFTMLDSYSLAADEAGLDQQYQAHQDAYQRIFSRCGLPVLSVAADVGMMGGQAAHEYMYLTPIGEDTLLLCTQCDYKANRQIARHLKTAVAAASPLPLEKVATPNCPTIDALATFLGIEAQQTAKAIFMTATLLQGETQVEKLVFVVVRGDMALNETKLANAIQAVALRPSTADEIAAVGAVAGYASPVGLADVWVVVDEAIPQSPNLVAGANEVGYHLKNVCYGRDYTADLIADLTAANDGDSCPHCASSLTAVRGVEVGNIFKLGTRYSQSMHAFYLDEQGNSQPIVMGSYGIGVTRLLACLAEHYHDDHGFVWPLAIAPYTVHLLWLANEEAQAVAETVYQQLQAAGIAVLFDDRAESAGVKFNDADLIGLPIRLTVSGRSLKNGGVEWKWRHQNDRAIIPVTAVVSTVQTQVMEHRSEATG